MSQWGGGRVRAGAAVAWAGRAAGGCRWPGCWRLPLAGLLFAVSGTRLVLGLDALTFLAVVPLALRPPAPARDTDGRVRSSFVRDARDGLAFVWRTPYVLAVAVGFWIVVLLRPR